ncbi:MAG: enoyl-CoA hydratase [Actinomycetia bacterium]|nr:enoyl-CoA hydratase [Actinomycetes bacterium]
MAIVSYQSSDSVGTITISRPERRNALNHTALEELHAGVRQAASDELRCLVVTGDAGHFCAGADLTELEDMAFTEALRATLDDLGALEFPTIAAIAGSCMGLGVQIALACDLRIATPDARFAVPVAKLGLMVDHWTVQRLALNAGHSTARWMMLTAEPISAGHAADVGLVQRLIEPETEEPGAEVLADASRLAANIATLAPLALAGSKLGLDLLERPAGEADPDGAYRAAFERAWASDDLTEGRRAFGERRSPEFRGQ